MNVSVENLKDEPGYPYDVSVVVPVYNAECSIGDTINSLMAQTHPFSKIQVILVDNASTDRSKEICLGYVLEYENMELYTEERRGVSFARNTGMDAARGKYILFLDSDDKFGKSTVAHLLSFFEDHRDEVDLVSYHMTTVRNGQKVKEHIRYQFLQETGIYDLDSTFYALPTNMNFCIKNGTPHRFDTKWSFQEDQKFCAEILLEKRKLGYVKEAEYWYGAGENGLTSVNDSPIAYFETSTGIFEELFTSCDVVPKFLQTLFFHDCEWKFKSNHFWPYHYGEEELKRARERIISLLRQVDDDVILAYPGIDAYEKHYWLRLKDQGELMCMVGKQGVSVFDGNQNTYFRSTLEVVLRKIRVQDGVCVIRGFFKSIAFSFTGKPEAQAIVNGEAIPLRLVDCAGGYYKVKEKTDVFWGFELSVPVREKTVVQFEIAIDGIPLRTVFLNPVTVEFDKDKDWYLAGNTLICQKKRWLECTQLSGKELSAWRKKEIAREVGAEAKRLRLLSRECAGRNIWLYTDAAPVLSDNAYLQFRHDLAIDDGIERYYVITNSKCLYRAAAETDPNRLVSYGSDLHKKLFFACKKLLTSFSDEEVIWPIADAKERKRLRGAFNGEVIYLQHGILHAHLPWYYSKYCCGVDRFVISSQFERENLTHNYDYEDRDFLMTGMPRFDGMDIGRVPEGIILFAPSWRSYLVKKGGQNTLYREKNLEAFRSSDYLKGILEFLQNETLQKFLEQKNLTMEVKLHPEFQKLYADELCRVETGRIQLYRGGNFDVNKYCLLITDFSSILYDFVYLQRPILYFVPDILQFKAGLNHYRELDMPFEKGFGPLNTEAPALIDSLCAAGMRNFRLTKEQRNRYKNFFANTKDCCEAIYRSLISEREER